MSDDYVKAAPLCEKHQPNGGTRGMCVICAGESLQHALSRISYACEPPNEMQCSSFDVHMDETAVVTQVVAQAERIRVLEGEVARMKTVPMKYRRMEFNAQLQHENATLTERVRVLREAVQNSIDASDAASAEMATKLIAQGITSIPISDLTAKAYEAAGALRAALEATK